MRIQALFFSQLWLLSASRSVFPLQNGFPTPNASQLASIEQHGLGTLPDGELPAKISTQGVTNFQLIALNELAEVAFFTELLWNITNHVDGYDISYGFALDTLEVAQQQEQLHALNANAVLQHFGAEPILPCMYSFPVACFEEAIRYASTFTSVGAGTLQAMIEIFAQNDDIHFAGALASVLGQEGEQGGFYRVLQQKVPNELPFLTTGTREFLFSWLHGVISTESCPSLDMIDLPVFAPLNLITDPAPETANITFTFDSREGGTPVNPVFINQQNTPIVQPMSVLSSVGTVITAQAEFPYDEYEMNGLTIVVLTNHTGPFVDAQAVANATVFGPAFIVL